MKIKLTVFLIMSYYFSSALLAQKFQITSEPVSLEITHSAFMDTIKPTVEIIAPMLNFIPDKPIYSNTDYLTLKGLVADNKKHLNFVEVNKKRSI